MKYVPEGTGSAVPLLNSSAVLAAEPAMVRFVAVPWAEVRIDDDLRFHTPRAEPVSLEAGEHRVVFHHPSLGSKEYVLRLAPGEARRLRHVFEERP